MVGEPRRPNSRMVKKLETVLIAEFTTLLLPQLQRACFLSHHAYSTPMEGGTSRGGRAYGVEDIAGVHHGNSRSRNGLEQRVSGDRESHPAQPDQGARTLE